ncbi:DUF1937 family protein [Thioclava sp. F36-6]|uniref:DUF1937 family protein n=1 Tax=Thioclava sp. F36-6 TaxID=1915316 RepID=UPI00099657C5|nr:DUF1937 family protein [Thioclava sp. F36-6]OOY31601.1 hypothetical protein BMI88_11005 [Thioclava sp. F36-6]
MTCAGIQHEAPDWSALQGLFDGSKLLRPGVSVPEVAGLGSGRSVYLATPYRREVTNADGRFDRWLGRQAASAAALWSWRLAQEGASAVSPVILSTAICEVGIDLGQGPDPLDDNFWSAWCLPLMRDAAVFAVPPISGWDRSIGVWREACWALERNVPVCLIASPVAEVC